MRKKADADDTIPTIFSNEMSSSEARQNWARLIQKIYEVDPLICPKCQGQMKIISIIDDFDIIDKILRVSFLGRGHIFQSYKKFLAISWQKAKKHLLILLFP